MKFFLFISLFFLLTGCGTEEVTGGQQSVEMKQLSTNSSSIEQTPANEVKQSLLKYEEITGIKAANTDKEMIIAVQIKHSKRFTMAKLRKKWQKEIEKQFPDLKIELSTDKKIYLELEDLEGKIASDSLTEKKLKKKVKDIIKLSKEQT